MLKVGGGTNSGEASGSEIDPTAADRFPRAENAVERPDVQSPRSCGCYERSDPANLPYAGGLANQNRRLGASLFFPRIPKFRINRPGFALAEVHDCRRGWRSQAPFGLQVDVLQTKTPGITPWGFPVLRSQKGE